MIKVKTVTKFADFSMPIVVKYRYVLKFPLRTDQYANMDICNKYFVLLIN